MLNFGLGQVALIPSGATPTPVPVALLTEAKVDFSYKEVEYRGNQQAPIETAFAELEIKITAKTGNINGATLSSLLAGSTTATGGVLGVLAELWTIPATPYQVTVANGVTYADDLGVLDLTANKWLTRVAAGPTTGQYALNSATGQYTFAAADTTHNLAINYSYTSASIGKSVALNNQLAGTTPIFALALYNAYQIAGTTRYHGLKFPAAVCPKLSLAFASTKYTEEDLSFSIRQDTASTKIVTAYTQE